MSQMGAGFSRNGTGGAGRREKTLRLARGGKIISRRSGGLPFYSGTLNPALAVRRFAC